MEDAGFKFSLNSNFLTSFVILLITATCVDSRHCFYKYDSGYEKQFVCSAYEYCCGPMCCRSRAISFYQLWYFWLMIILMLLLCSGGGWWYRFRYRGQFQNQQSHLAFPTTTITPTIRPHVYGAKPFQAPIMSIGPPPPYPAQGPAVQPSQPFAPDNSAAINMPVTGPPPPYTGPPPSYTVAVGASTANQ